MNAEVVLPLNPEKYVFDGEAPLSKESPTAAKYLAFDLEQQYH